MSSEEREVMNQRRRLSYSSQSISEREERNMERRLEYESQSVEEREERNAERRLEYESLSVEEREERNAERRLEYIPQPTEERERINSQRRASYVPPPVEERERINSQRRASYVPPPLEEREEVNLMRRVEYQFQSLTTSHRYLARGTDMPTIDDMKRMDKSCRHCCAKFWLCEKTSGKVDSPKFNHCCSDGKEVLPIMGDLRQVPELLQLFNGSDNSSRDFRDNIRAYNSLLSFTSCGAKVDASLLVERTGVFTYRIHGEMYHLIGSLLPEEGREPSFLQLYFYDTDNELENRMRSMRNRNHQLIESLQQILRNANPWINFFKSALESNDNSVGLTLRITADGRDQRTYNQPTSSDVAAIIPGENSGDRRDILIQSKSNQLIRISETHRAYDTFSYVLLFPTGEYGWHKEMRKSNGKSLTPMDFYQQHLYFKAEHISIHRGGRLFLQWVVDVWARIEQYRLIYIRHHQNEIRSEVYQGLLDAINNNTSLENIGRRVILPSSFVGSPRYMIQLYQDAMAIVREFGKPDLFLTFTCNPNIPEIQNELLPHQKANDRPDIIVRVFKEKLKRFKEDIVNKSIFGRVIAYVYTIEFQKRGLPHCHLLLILHNEDKLRTAQDFDSVVSAEIPDRRSYPLAFDTVTKHLIHGPCGDLNPRYSLFNSIPFLIMFNT